MPPLRWEAILLPVVPVARLCTSTEDVRHGLALQRCRAVDVPRPRIGPAVAHEARPPRPLRLASRDRGGLHPRDVHPLSLPESPPLTVPCFPLALICLSRFLVLGAAPRLLLLGVGEGFGVRRGRCLGGLVC